MSKAILEIEMPKSCGDCSLKGNNEDLDYEDHEGYGGAVCYAEKSHYMEVSYYLNANTCHPDCPLKKTEDNLRWEIIDLGTTQRITGHRCPNCGAEKYTCKFNYCPNCGVRLLPPIKVN